MNGARYPPVPPRPRSRGARRLLLFAFLVSAVVVAGLLVHFSTRVYAFRSLRAEGPAWSFPSRIYSAGVTLEPGRVAPYPYLVAELRARGYRADRAPLRRPGSWARTAGGIEIFVRGFLEAPDPDGQGGPERVWIRVDTGVVAVVQRLGGMPGNPPPDTTRPARLLTARWREGLESSCDLSAHPAR